MGGINPNELYDEFVKHINSMTREELIESARKAEEMTAGCDDDWPDDLVQVVRCKNCCKRYTIACPMYHDRSDSIFTSMPGVADDYTNDDGFCDRGIAR